ncbi:MAG: glycosyl transferase group 1 [Fibrobacteres bacterium]|nr:glycosyl transferase group 1 [Fibrobacterota bacterium]
MKVAFFAYDLSESSGWGRYTVQILKRMAGQGIEPIVFSIRGSGGNPALAGIPHYPILRSYRDGAGKAAFVLLDYLSIRGKIRECQALHCFVEPFLPLASLLAGRDKKLFASAVGTYSIQTLKTPWWGWWYRRSFLKCRRILAISRYTGARLAGALHGTADKILAVPLGVEMDGHRTHPPAAARESAFMTVGEIKPRKGVLEAVQAFGKVVKNHPLARFYIVGLDSPSAYVEKIKKVIEQSGLKENVIWKGRVSQAELDALYSRVRGFVLPSLNVDDQFEGFGLVHLEANALGLPAIGSSDCGNEDAILDGKSGFLVGQGDISGLAAAMEKLLDPAYPWDELARSAVAFARSMDWEKPSRRYAETFLGIPG